MKYQIKHYGKVAEVETVTYKGNEYYKGVKIFEEDGVWKSKKGRETLPYSGASRERLLSYLLQAEENGNRDLI